MDPEEDDSDRTVIGRSRIARAPIIKFGHFLSYAEDGQPVRRPIPAAGCTIGRTAPAELAIASPEVSRRHCRIEVRGDYAILTDLGSTNGTRVNGKQIERPTRLLSGAQIALGSYPIRYERRDSREVAEEAELSADLQRAEAYVRAILPQPINTGPVQVQWCFMPSARLGGDAFGYQFLNDEVFTGFLLDVSGHGIGAAMHAANVANALRRHALPGVDFQDPVKVAAGVNRMFPMEEHNELMLTLWYFSYHLPSRQLRYCAAGHHASLLLTPGVPGLAELWQRGPAIGMLPSGNWTSGACELPPDSKLFIFSDGAFEIVTGDGRQWNMQDLTKVILEPPTPGLNEPQRLYRAVRAASRSGPLEDDFSMMFITFE